MVLVADGVDILTRFENGKAQGLRAGSDNRQRPETTIGQESIHIFGSPKQILLIPGHRGWFEGPDRRQARHVPIEQRKGFEGDRAVRRTRSAEQRIA